MNWKSSMGVIARFSFSCVNQVEQQRSIVSSREIENCCCIEKEREMFFYFFEIFIFLFL